MTQNIIITGNRHSQKHSNIMEMDPYNSKTATLLREYDTKNNTSYFKFNEKTCEKYSKREYEIVRMTEPVFSILLYTLNKEENIKSICLVEYENDLKQLRVSIDSSNKDIIGDVADYAFKNMKMESIIVFVNKNDKNILKELISNGYTPLFDDYDSKAQLPFLIEKDVDAYKDERSIICV